MKYLLLVGFISLIFADDFDEGVQKPVRISYQCSGYKDLIMKMPKDCPSWRVNAVVANLFPVPIRGQGIPVFSEQQGRALSTNDINSLMQRIPACSRRNPAFRLFGVRQQ